MVSHWNAERHKLVVCCQSPDGARTAAIHIRAFETCQSATGPEVAFRTLITCRTGGVFLRNVPLNV